MSTRAEALTAEFENIRFRVGRSSKPKERKKYEKGDWATFLAYVDARDVMQRLDDVIGWEHWSDEYEDIGGMLVCRLTVDGTTKCDTGSESNVEKEKGHFSDAFKRAAVKFGIGRHLYGMKSPFLRFDDGHFDTYGNITDKGIAMIVGKKEQPKEVRTKVNAASINAAAKKAEEAVDFIKSKIDECTTFDAAMEMFSDEEVVVRYQWLKTNFKDHYNEVKAYAEAVGNE